MKKNFSQRIGLEPIKDQIQINDIDDELKNELWNMFYLNIFQDCNENRYSIQNIHYEVFLRRLWMHFFKLNIDNIYTSWKALKIFIKERYNEFEWNEVCDFIEWTVQDLEDKELEKMFNQILERQLSAYRFIDFQLTQISTKEEKEAIEQAIEDTSQLKPVYNHLKSALIKLSDRNNPDYRNSIKESISAVEALCRIITKDSKTSLGDALKQLEKNGIAVHASLKSAWLKLYGYTSDKDGIRHSLSNTMEEISFEEARYMLVSCSAFVSYLLILAEKADISIN